jgi:hypothetical protein
MNPLDLSTTARLRLGFAVTDIKTAVGMPPPRPPAFDASMVSTGCPFCDDAGCFASCGLPRAASGSISPVEIDDDDETVIRTLE